MVTRSRFELEPSKTKQKHQIRQISDVRFSEKCPLSNFVHAIGPKEQLCPGGLFKS